MKKINLNAISKRKLIAGGSVLVGVTLVITVLAFNTAAKVPESNSVESSSSVAPTSTEVSVNDIKAIDSTSSTEEIFTPSSGVSQSSELTKIEKPSAPPAPVIDGNVTSSGTETQTTNPILTDKSQKPKYTTPPKATVSSSTTKPSTKTNSSKKPSSKSTGGSTDGGNHAGQVYVEGFGWVTKPQGDGNYSTVSGDGDINKQVATMD